MDAMHKICLIKLSRPVEIDIGKQYQFSPESLTSPSFIKILILNLKHFQYKMNGRARLPNNANAGKMLCIKSQVDATHGSLVNGRKLHFVYNFIELKC